MSNVSHQKHPVSPVEYEQLVESLLRGLRSERLPQHATEIQGGKRNLIAGASGFMHQIDVSVRVNSILLLVECKLWGKHVGAQAVLVHHSRISDIQEFHTGQGVHGSIVSTKRPTMGARMLAKWYGIRLDTVESAHEYILSVGNDLFVGKHAIVRSSASIEFKVIRKSDG